VRSGESWTRAEGGDFGAAEVMPRALSPVSEEYDHSTGQEMQPRTGQRR